MIDIESPTEKEIKRIRSESGKSLLVIYPLDWREEKGLVEGIPLIGWGIVFPEIENEIKVEFAARPIVNGAEESQDDDDTDIESDEN